MPSVTGLRRRTAAGGRLPRAPALQQRQAHSTRRYRLSAQWLSLFRTRSRCRPRRPPSRGRTSSTLIRSGPVTGDGGNDRADLFIAGGHGGTWARAHMTSCPQCREVLLRVSQEASAMGSDCAAAVMLGIDEWSQSGGCRLTGSRSRRISRRQNRGSAGSLWSEPRGRRREKLTLLESRAGDGEFVRSGSQVRDGHRGVYLDVLRPRRGCAVGCRVLRGPGSRSGLRRRTRWQGRSRGWPS